MGYHRRWQVLFLDELCASHQEDVELCEDEAMKEILQNTVSFNKMKEHAHLFD